MRKIYLLVLVFLIILGLRFFFFYSSRQVYEDGQAVVFKTTLLSQPQLIGNQSSFSANLPNGEIVFIKTNENSFNFGDRLIISGNLKSQLLTNRNEIWTLNKPDIKFYSNSLSVFSDFRQHVTSLFETILPRNLASLLLGIVFGIKGDMDKNFLLQLRNGGFLHVIAASGMNVVMVSGFLSYLFAVFLKRQLALWLSLVGIVLYAILSGLEPSILRASIMGGLVFISQILGRQAWAGWGLFLAAFLMLFITPTLISNVSFQLSFAATAGLLYIKPSFDIEKMAKIIDKSIIGEDVVITICAQLATIPILLASFGNYSLWSVIVNALILWTVPVLMVLGGVGALFSLIFIPLGSALIYLTLPILSYIEKIVSIFGNGDGVWQIENFPWQFIVGYYLLLVAVLYVLRRKS